MPLVRGCRNRYCAEYGDESGWCPAHRPPPYRHVSAPMGPGWDRIRAASSPGSRPAALRPVPATDVHHVVSRAAGGGNEPGNLRSLCHPYMRRSPARRAARRGREGSLFRFQRGQLFRLQRGQLFRFQRGQKPQNMGRKMRTYE